MTLRHHESDYEEISNDQTDQGSPLDEHLLDQGLRVNLGDHETRLGLLESEPDARYIFKDDFDGAIDTTNTLLGKGWKYTATGTGAGVSIDTTAYANHPGVMAAGTGSTATGKVQLHLQAGSQYVRDGALIFEWIVRLPSYVVTTNEWRITLGLASDPTSHVPTHGITFKFDKTTSDNWITCTRNNSGSNESPSSQAVVTGAWLKLRAVVNADGSEVKFYYGQDGGALSLIATHTTFITSAINIIPYFLFESIAGTVGKTMFYDYFLLDKILATGR